MASAESNLEGEVQPDALDDLSVPESAAQPSDSHRPTEVQTEMNYSQPAFYVYGQAPTLAVSPYAMQTMMSALPSYQQQPQHHYNHTFNQAHYVQTPLNNRNPAYLGPFRQSIPHHGHDQYLPHNLQQFQPHIARPNQSYGTGQLASMSHSDSIYQMNQHQYLYGTNLSSMSQQGSQYQGQERFSQDVYSSIPQAHGGQPTPKYSSMPVNQGSRSPSQNNSTLRGPPRKPKQSGHALWVGNLPPGTHINSLKDYFSTDATKEIESVFLISKSNCAFVNYKTEEACIAAMSRFNDSNFGGARLVCRHRRGSNGNSPAPSQTAQSKENEQVETLSAELDQSARTSNDNLPEAIQSISDPQPITTERVPEKFFIIKSLTVDDLERSVNSGLWATQAHNEETLNRAFQTADSVYLIFSANKSGEYFGYARMESLISATDSETASDATATANTEAQTIVLPGSRRPTDLPVTIRTPATATAPEGRIIDDSGRGTIFWEAYSDEPVAELSESAEIAVGSVVGTSPTKEPAFPQPAFFGKSFAIKWVSTERLPFYRTRGLRNPWNANREVKIARDGTELEPGVGRRLINMFEHQSQMNAPGRAQEGLGQYGQYPPGMPHQSMYQFR